MIKQSDETYLFPFLSPFHFSAEGNQFPPLEKQTFIGIIVRMTNSTFNLHKLQGAKLVFRRGRYCLTVVWGLACGYEWDTEWSWWNVVYTCVWWSEANRWGFRQSAPGPSHSSYSTSPERDTTEWRKCHLSAYQNTTLCCIVKGFAQDYLFPHSGRKSCSFNNLHIQETLTCGNIVVWELHFSQALLDTISRFSQAAVTTFYRKTN